MSRKFRIAASIILGIAAITVLIIGREEPGCGGRETREALVRLIGDRLYEKLGPNQVYELVWRPDDLVVKARDESGCFVCLSGFDYRGPDGQGLLTVYYTAERARRGGRVQVRITDMDVDVIK